MTLFQPSKDFTCEEISFENYHLQAVAKVLNLNPAFVFDEDQVSALKAFLTKVKLGLDNQRKSLGHNTWPVTAEDVLEGFSRIIESDNWHIENNFDFVYLNRNFNKLLKKQKNEELSSIVPEFNS